MPAPKKILKRRVLSFTRFEIKAHGPGYVVQCLLQAGFDDSPTKEEEFKDPVSGEMLRVFSQEWTEYEHLGDAYED